jgi:hypothetical protein
LKQAAAMVAKTPSSTKKNKPATKKTKLATKNTATKPANKKAVPRKCNPPLKSAKKIAKADQKKETEVCEIHL